MLELLTHQGVVFQHDFLVHEGPVELSAGQAALFEVLDERPGYPCTYIVVETKTLNRVWGFKNLPAGEVAWERLINVETVVNDPDCIKYVVGVNQPWFLATGRQRVLGDWARDVVPEAVTTA